MRTLRRRYLTAIATVLALAGCRERGRWADEEGRSKPRARVTPAELAKCQRGNFCVEAPSRVEVPAEEPYAYCDMSMSIPPTAATSVPADKRRMLRLLFDRQASEGEKRNCCYTWFEHCRGRALLDRTKSGLVIAPIVARADWRAASEVPRGGTGLDPARWLNMAAHEHASIASFAQAALALLALGAPAELVAGHHAAALDEIRHARICFALAEACDGQLRGPGSIDLTAARPLPRTLDDLAQATFVEGCVGETVAAELVAGAARRAADEGEARLLMRIAADERHHAALAWRTLAWTITRGATFNPTIGNPGVGDAGASAWQRAVTARAVVELVEPCVDQLLAWIEGQRCARISPAAAAAMACTASASTVG